MDDIEFDSSDLQALRALHGRAPRRKRKSQNVSEEDIQLNVRVAPSLKGRIVRLSESKGLLLREVLAEAIDDLEIKWRG